MIDALTLIVSGLAIGISLVTLAIHLKDEL